MTLSVISPPFQMTSLNKTAIGTFLITPRACQKINELCHASSSTTKMLKIKVEGGGCAGFQYAMTLVSDASEGDILFQADGALVCIDPDTLPLISGSVLVFEEDMMSAAFAIKNPNAVTGCGCGNSFSLL